MKPFRSFLVAACAAACVSAFGPVSDASAFFSVSINQFAEHPALDEIVRGFREQLEELGIEVYFSEHNAKADIAAIGPIVDLIIGEKPDLVLAVATPSAQETAKRVKDVPVLFAGVTDPLDAGIVASLSKPGANVTGTMDLNPVAAQLELIKEIQPSAGKIGIVYNPNESNSVVQMNLARKAAAASGLSLVEAMATDAEGVAAAARSLAGKADAIFLPADSTVVSAMDAVVGVSLDRKIPLYPANDDSLRKGGVACLSISNYQLGRLTGRMAGKILVDGAEPGLLPVEEQTELSLTVNTAFADRIGLEIPASVLSRADETLSQ
ncbi:MAG: ABC transporter substrate-binding protein [Deltaproteobacteria bacterium]|jgi:putative ABC transport system substrate-binding protein|nr:ABC transporter substrate-binding protein [Deltaproteobacteria bacterium]